MHFRKKMSRHGLLQFERMLNFKNFFTLLSIFIFLFTNCARKEVLYNLNQEVEFALEKEEFLLIDFMKEDSEAFLEKGWSKLFKNGTRIGIYPKSELHFILSEVKPIYIYSSAKPYEKGNFPARDVHIKINNEELALVHSSDKSSRNLKIPIPSQSLKKGRNTVEFIYDAEKRTEEIPSTQKKKRDYSLIFRELIFSSLEHYDHLKQYSEFRERVRGEYKDIFAQNIPSTVDFFLELPAQSVFNAKLKFLSSRQDKQQKKPVVLDIVIEKIEDKETIHQFSFEEGSSEKEIKIDLPPGKGIARLRLKVQATQNQENPSGLLLWTEALIKKKKGEEKKRARVSSKSLDKLRTYLQNMNTIIIIWDAARADHFSNYGYFRPTTPNAARFAQDAALFTNAFSESLTTRSSIGTLFTGFPIPVTNLRKVTSNLPQKLTTLAQLFKSKDFKTTGYTGVGNIGSFFNFHKGFDEYFELFKKKGFIRKSQQYVPYLFPWLEANTNKNYFLYVHFKEPHAIYIPRPPFRGMFSDKYEKKVDLSGYQGNVKSVTDEEMEYIRACYDETLASVDSVFGEFLDKMKELDLLEKSIIILTADHGEFLGEKNKVFGHGTSFGDKGIHIPLIIRFPKETPIEIPQKIESMVKMSDLFATLSDIYQFDIPHELYGGRSLLPLFLDPNQEINPYITVGRLGVPAYCYRTKQHKLVYWKVENSMRFYDLEKDPEEKNNIYSGDNIRANFYLSSLKKWLASQQLIRKFLITGDASGDEADLKRIDNQTLENLKALGYIK